MRKILVPLCMLISYCVYGQISMNSEGFVYLFSGEKVNASSVEYREHFMGGGYFVVGKERFSADLIKFYQDERGFFANTKRLNFSKKSIFSKRIMNGKVNLYERVKFHTTPSYKDANGFYNPGTSSVTIKSYYNKGFDDLKKANYKNLSIDLTDNSESIRYLNKYKKIRNAQTVLSIVGGVLVAGGLSTLYLKTKDVNYNDPNHKNPNITPNMLVAVIGGGFIGASYYLSFPKRDKLKKAIDAYNWE